MTYKKLSEVADIYTGIRTPRYMSDESQNTEKIISNKIADNKLHYETIKVDDNIDKKYYSKKDDIIIHLLNTTQIHMLTEENILIPFNYAIIRSKNVNAQYIYHILKSNQFNHVKKRINEGTQLKVLKVSHLKDIKIKIISPESQEKYGHLLNLVDKHIQTKEEQLKTEYEYKNELIYELLGEKYVRL